MDDFLLILFFGCVFELIVEEYGLIYFIEDVLFYIDRDFNDDEIIFYIIKGLYFIDENSNILLFVGDIIVVDVKIMVLKFI